MSCACPSQLWLRLVASAGGHLEHRTTMYSRSNCRPMSEMGSFTVGSGKRRVCVTQRPKPDGPGSSSVASPLGSRHSRGVLQSVTDGAFNLLGRERPIGRSSVPGAVVASVMSAAWTSTVVRRAMPRSAVRDARRGSAEAIWDTKVWSATSPGARRRTPYLPSRCAAQAPEEMGDLNGP